MTPPVFSSSVIKLLNIGHLSNDSHLRASNVDNDVEGESSAALSAVFDALNDGEMLSDQI